MGLDMYLHGRKSFTYGNEQKDEEGFTIDSVNVELGYWRKHPNLHGYIVETFANGVDECQDIGLNEDDIEKIINAIKAKELPETTGFFFGVSSGDDEERAFDIETFERALKWLKTDAPNQWRYVVYRASW